MFLAVFPIYLKKAPTHFTMTLILVMIKLVIAFRGMIYKNLRK